MLDGLEASLNRKEGVTCHHSFPMTDHPNPWCENCGISQQELSRKLYDLGYTSPQLTSADIPKEVIRSIVGWKKKHGN